MYYMLEEQPLEDLEELAVIDRYPDVEEVLSWLTGKKFDIEVREPLEFILDDDSEGRLSDYFNGSPPLMSNRLIAALREAGVDNIDTYPAVLKDGSGGIVSDDYVAINVVGVIRAADMSASVPAPEIPAELMDTSFDSLVIDESKTGGKLLFRLAECVTGIVIHEKVKNHLIEKGLDSLGFIEPENWMS